MIRPVGSKVQLGHTVARINAIMIRDNGYITYELCWWDVVRHEVWVPAAEIDKEDRMELQFGFGSGVGTGATSLKGSVEEN